MNNPPVKKIQHALGDISPATMLHLARVFDLKNELFYPILQLATDEDWSKILQEEIKHVAHNFISLSLIDSSAYLFIQLFYLHAEVDIPASNSSIYSH